MSVRCGVRWGAAVATLLLLACGWGSAPRGAHAQSFQYSRGWSAGKRGPPLPLPLPDHSPRLMATNSAATAADHGRSQLDAALAQLSRRITELAALKQLLLEDRRESLDQLKAKEYIEENERTQLRNLLDLSRAAQESMVMNKKS